MSEKQLDSSRRIRISAVESVQIERTGNTVRLSILIAGAPVLSKHIAPQAAQDIADALGYACNDVQFGGAR